MERHDGNHAELTRLVGTASVMLLVTGVMLWLSSRPYHYAPRAYGYGYTYGYGYGPPSTQGAFPADQVNWAMTSAFFGGLIALVALIALGYLVAQRRKYRRQSDAIWLLGLAAASDPELSARSTYLALSPGQRCSDLDRARVRAVVEHNYALGTLDLDELMSRESALHAATSLGELGKLLVGLRWRWPDLGWFADHPRWLAGIAAVRCRQGCCRHEHGCLKVLDAELSRLGQDLLPSEQERESVRHRLIDAVADGRLRLEELEERIEAVEAARSAAQLQSVVTDVPPTGRAALPGRLWA